MGWWFDYAIIMYVSNAFLVHISVVFKAFLSYGFSLYFIFSSFFVYKMVEGSRLTIRDGEKLGL
jgi:hypothetical protein